MHYIEGSTAQLVKHKALNLVDVGSSPVMRFTSYDVLFKEVYIKSQLNIILLSWPLGATGDIHIRGENHQTLSFEQIRLTGCLQQS